MHALFELQSLTYQHSVDHY